MRKGILGKYIKAIITKEKMEKINSALRTDSKSHRLNTKHGSHPDSQDSLKGRIN